LLSQSKSTGAAQSGVEKAFTVLQEMTSKSGGLDSIVKNPTAVLNASNTGMVDQLVDAVFGSKGSATLQLIQGVSGINTKSLSSLLGVAAPLVFGGLKKTVEGTGAQFTPSSMTSLLSSAAPEITKMLPAGLGNIIGMSGLASSVVGAATRAYAKSPSMKQEKQGMGMTPILLLLLAAAIGWLYNMRSTEIATNQAVTVASDALRIANEKAEKARLVAAEAQNTVIESARAALNNSANLAEMAQEALPNIELPKLGEVAGGVTSALSKKLPGGIDISFDASSIENRLISTIEDTSEALNNAAWMNFDKLNFETGSARITADSQAQIKNIAAILTAYPQTEIKLGGYTDNSGNADANLQLSAQRARATLAALVDLGISPARLSSEGYGSQFPVASNETPEGRAVNRRIAVRVTKK
jgi:outer membrane protein OmpA-like peptidoglycan-associated protein